MDAEGTFRFSTPVPLHWERIKLFRFSWPSSDGTHVANHGLYSTSSYATRAEYRGSLVNGCDGLVLPGFQLPTPTASDSTSLVFFHENERLDAAAETNFHADNLLPGNRRRVCCLRMSPHKGDSTERKPTFISRQPSPGSHYLSSGASTCSESIGHNSLVVLFSIRPGLMLRALTFPVSAACLQPPAWTRCLDAVPYVNKSEK